MKLQNLENGMIVTLRYGNECLLVDDKLIANNFRLHNKLDNYNDNLTSKGNEQYDIVKVQSFNKVDTLWERKEVDWSKVPFGTKVRVWYYSCNEKLEGRFIRYKDYEDTHKFEVFVEGKDHIDWAECELVEMEDTPTSNEIDKGHTEHCNQQDGCRECKYKSERCVIGYILENYNVSKK